MKKFLVINGPNLNLLGTREPEIYGSKTLDTIEMETKEKLKPLKVETTWFQSNAENEIIQKIHGLTDKSFDGLVINPGAYSHTSIAILDALKSLDIPIAEVHLSNTNKREEFRQKKMTAKGSTCLLEGLGDSVYYVGIIGLLELCSKGK